jgi:hypothetical protein
MITATLQVCVHQLQSQWTDMCLKYTQIYTNFVRCLYINSLHFSKSLTETYSTDLMSETNWN